MGFLSRFLFGLLIYCLIYLAAVRLVDADGDFGTHLFPVVLLQDHAKKEQLFEKYALDYPIAAVLLGSSRAMMLSPKLLERLTGLRYFNFCVSSASVNDISGIHNWLRAKGVHLEHIILGLDIDSMMVNSRAYSEDSRSALGRLVRQARDVKAMFTIPVAVDTWMAFAIWAGLIDPVKRISFAADGLEIIHEDLSGRAAYTAGCVVAWRSKFQNSDRISDRYFEQLESIPRQARSDGTTVTMFITPINPATERRMEEGTPYFDHKLEIRSRVKALAAKWKVDFADFGDANTFGANAEGWSDCVHYDEENADRLIQHLLLSRQ